MDGDGLEGGGSSGAGRTGRRVNRLERGGGMGITSVVTRRVTGYLENCARKKYRL